MSRTKIGWKTATALVVSNMIGTGVFTSLGYQVTGLHNTFSILLLWSAGGLLALIGAFVYVELAACFRQSGGDYIYLSRTYHPVMGYLTSWVSLFIGFSAPISLAALAMSKYLQAFGWQLGKGFAISVILAVAVFQSVNLSVSSRFQNLFTLVKILFVLGLIAVGIWMAPVPEHTALLFDSSWTGEMLAPAFAISLVYVTFAYTGWNSASYIVEEIDRPHRNLPIALFLGVGFVTAAYILLQYVFLKHAGISELTGQEDIANISFRNILGTTNVRWISFFIALQLVATISGYLWIGSRLTQATAKEHYCWSSLKKTNEGAIPVRAIWAHAVVSILIIFSGSFETIFTYASFVLQLLATAAVSTAFFIPGSRRMFIKSNLFYLLPALFLAASLYICYYVLMERTRESLIGLFIIVAGILMYWLDEKMKRKAALRNHRK